jgi:hypothetical protein
MSTLTEQVANLVTATDGLTGEVISKLGQINSELDAKKAEIDAYWVSKSNQIDTDWNNKEIEINQRLEDFDNLVFYAKPTSSGTGDGLSSANAATLQDILDNKLVNSVKNKVYLAPGLHVLNSGTTIEDYYIVHFLPEGTYDNLNPPIIITPSTTDADISRDEIGNPSPSQVCTAHDSDEYPLVIKNSMVAIENVRFRGTRHALRLEKSTATISGEVHFDVWVFSISCTAHRGVGLYCVDSKVYGSGQWHINIYHPDYTACSDVLSNYAAPIVCERSEIYLNGRLEWTGNIPVAELPTENVPKYRATVESSPRTCINARDKSFIRIQNFTYKSCVQLFYAETQSVIDVQYVEAIGTEPVKWIGQAIEYSKILLSNKFDDWPTDAQKKFKVENTGNVTENASVIANIKSEIYLEGIEVIGTCACSTFALLDKDSEFYMENSIISAENRDANLGFFKILQNYNSRAFLKNSVMTTRNGDSDTAITTISGRVTSNDNSITSTTSHYQNNFGIIIKDGVAHGGKTFTEPTHILIPDDFSNLEEVISYLKDKSWSSTIYIDIAAGNFEFGTSNLYSLANVVISGADPIEKNVISLISITGSSGNYDVTLQLSDTNGLQNGNFLNIQSNVYNEGISGVGSDHLSGCHKIKSISGNNVTLNMSYIGSISSSTTVTGGRVVYLPTQISFGEIGIWFHNSMVTIQNMCLIGSDIYTHWLSSSALISDANSSVFISKLGIVNFGKALIAKSTSYIKAQHVCASNNRTGVAAVYNGFCLLIIGATTGNSLGGALSMLGGTISFSASYAYGNGVEDVLAHNSGLVVGIDPSYVGNISPILNTVGNANSLISNYVGEFI